MSDHMTQSLDELKAAILEDGIIDADEVAKLKERLYDDGIIDREEADFLFDLNDATSGNANDPAWQALFVEALSDHVLKDDESPGEIDDDEAKYLIEKIKGDGVVDANELALLVNICATATGESPADLTQFVLDSVQAAVVEDGIVDADEIELMKKVIYGAGGAGGSDVDRAEAEMLFAINDACEENDGKHDAAWKDLFAEAIGKHVLEDETSPGEIDDEEADWLIAKLTAQGGDDYSENEKALLAYIKANAKSIAPKLQFKIEAFG